MTESPSSSPLRQRFAGFDQVTEPTRFALGHAGLDTALGGGLPRGRLHEFWPARPEDGPSAIGFALLLALRAGGRGGNIVWLTQDRAPRCGRLYPPGLAELGADPARLLFVTAPDEASLLRAAADVVRSPAAGTAVIAPGVASPAIDLTATRRLTLFAERSGVTALLVRQSDPHCPSAAATRWCVAAAPSPLLEADAPGAPAFMVECTRQRGGAPVAATRLEWQRDDGRFAPLSGAAPADAGGRRRAAGG
ncbi:ImuA family protein [Sphingomonas nostoxanthinifaciens]|uniref:ImuA family protein n=1 Tax=Sphingomonas nostoxanthinifaciens TaxID=2872652 RepID=UPI001CC1F9E6|nr:hypothetical protein [Sphingomonas nostoxanthinifaciens]